LFALFENSTYQRPENSWNEILTPTGRPGMMGTVEPQRRGAAATQNGGFYPTAWCVNNPALRNLSANPEGNYRRPVQATFYSTYSWQAFSSA
jgi:hypothetical protein